MVNLPHMQFVGFGFANLSDFLLSLVFRLSANRLRMCVDEGGFYLNNGQ